MDNKTLMTDFYELTMAQTYFDEGKKDEIVYFDIFFRNNPFGGGYTISGGLDNIIKYIQNFQINDREINYLRKSGNFSENFLEYLKSLKFTGDIYAIPDGTVVFPNEPILTIRAKTIEAQLIETALLSCFNYGSLVLTSTKRIINEVKKVPVMEFGARRARGIDAAIEASKYAYIGGCIGTSNTIAGMEYDIPVVGTMAHSLVTEANSEYQAFLGYAMSNPDNALFLVDTYDTLKSGVPNAIKVAKEYLIPNGYKLKGVRIDSGDLAYLSKETRKMLDEAGFNDAKICLSNGLNEYSIKDLIAEGAEFDSLGVGDNISAAKERLGGIYKLVAVEKGKEIIPRIKLSNDTIKTINPGYKKVYRFYDKDSGYALGDVISLYDEKIPNDRYVLIHPVDTWKKKEISNYFVKELQTQIYKNGELIYEEPSIQEKRDYSKGQLETVYQEIKRLDKPHEYYVDLSQKLLDLKNQLIEKYKNENYDDKGKKLVKKWEGMINNV